MVLSFFKSTACLFVVLLASFVIVFYIIDPLQLFHKSWFHDNKFFNSMREQAAGIINSFDYDSIILGTSMLENTSAREASAKLGGKFVNISLAGSNFRERALVLDRALKKDISRVIYSLDTWYCLNNETENPSYDIKYWDYLFDGNPLNDFKMYLKAKFLLSPRIDSQLAEKDPDRPMAWYNDPAESSKFGGLEKWIDHANDTKIASFLKKELPEAALKSLKNGKKGHEPNPEREKQAEQYLDEYVLRFAMENPKTMFHFILPPYYRYYYANLLQNDSETYAVHQHVVRYLVERISEMPNAEIYGYEDQDAVDDIANYKDIAHYHPDFNSWFVDSIAEGSHRLTPDNVDKYLDDSARKAASFNIPALNREVRRLLP